MILGRNTSKITRWPPPRVDPRETGPSDRRRALERPRSVPEVRAPRLKSTTRGGTYRALSVLSSIAGVPGGDRSSAECPRWGTDAPTDAAHRTRSTGVRKSPGITRTHASSNAVWTAMYPPDNCSRQESWHPPPAHSERTQSGSSGAPPYCRYVAIDTDQATEDRSQWFGPGVAGIGGASFFADVGDEVRSVTSHAVTTTRSAVPSF